MLTDCKMGLSSEIFLPNAEVATNNVTEFVLQKTFNIAREQLRPWNLRSDIVENTVTLTSTVSTSVEQRGIPSDGGYLFYTQLRT